MTMTNGKRAQLRALQDDWLALPTVAYRVRQYGEDYRIAGRTAPTYRQVRECVLPEWETFFRGFFEEE